jgi:TatD DNase family protein
MNLIDTHCHIHSQDYSLDPDEVILRAQDVGVMSMVCIGTTALDSEKAVEFASSRDGLYASIGLHPHDAKLGEDDFEILASLMSEEKVVAVGECGLDYFYENSSKIDQERALRYQIELALSFQKPIVFHVREAFADFWPIFDSYSGIKGVVHSFTGTREEMEQAIERGLYIGINGIMTFTKNSSQLETTKAIPLERLLLETDSPYLTPNPKRGTINEPANVELVAEFLSRLREVSVTTLSEATTGNARALFCLE